MADAATGPEAPRARDVLRSTGPRVARDAFGPLLSFFVLWRLVGLFAGIAAAVIAAGLLYSYERRRGRPGMVVRLSLALVLIRAVVGLVSGSTATYLGQEIAIDTALATAFLGSIVANRPLTELFAAEIYPLPDELRAHPAYRRTQRIITLTWGLYFFARACVRLLAFLTLTKSAYVLVLAVSDVPFLLALLAWSVWYATRRLRREPVFAAALASG